MKLENVPPEMERKNPYEGQRQIRTHYFIGEMLPEMPPEDAAAFICFTNIDLYPDEHWNYVFGQASLENRVGVGSLYRFGNPDKSAADFKKFLARALKIAMHETGHMFSMRHCAKYECLMPGTNHLGEADRRAPDACPECMAKIAWAMNYEPAERYRNLAAFWEKQNWTEEKELSLKKPKPLARRQNNSFYEAFFEQKSFYRLCRYLDFNRSFYLCADSEKRTEIFVGSQKSAARR